MLNRSKAMLAAHALLLTTVLSLAPADITAQYAERRDVVRRVVLGGLDVPEWQAFSREPQLLAWPGGGVGVGAADNAGVVVVSPNGGLVRRVGHEGQGPGEFQAIGGFGIVGDTLWLRNEPEPRISQFDTAGTHLSTWRSPVQYNERYSLPPGITGLLRGGYRYATPGGFVLGLPPRNPKPVLLFRDDGGVIDTLAMRPGYDGFVVERLGIFYMRPFPQPPFVRPRPDGAGLAIARWADGPDVTLSLFDHTGREVDRHTYSFTRAPVTARFLAALVDSGVAMAREPYERARREGLPVPPDLEEAVAAGFGDPETFPPIQEMFVALDGNIWLWLIAGEDGGDWLVLGPDGDPLGQVTPPDGVRFQSASGSSVWGTWFGDFDVPYVARFEVLARDR
jgi:hypothetical protein